MTSTSIKLFDTAESLRRWRSQQLAPGRKIGFVPTMGALHEGHARLLREARRDCDELVLSIFVNPTQFGPNEDLAKYPRTFERDLELARREGVDAVFAPTPAVMYPPGYSTYVEETRLTQPLCGAFRPGHFRGVTTVVLKLFNLVQPQLALFGLKDAQQFFVLDRMTRDLDLDIAVEGVPTVREADGLALSSRNAYLSAEDRAKAPLLYKVLQETAAGLAQEAAPAESLLTLARERLASGGFKPQYFECLELPTLAKAETLSPDKPYLLATAAFLGSEKPTRLIDNVILRPELLSRYGVKTRS